jgi:hypothetical protein
LLTQKSDPVAPIIALLIIGIGGPP